MDYNKLLEKAREAYKNAVTGAEKRRLESIFPELAESEDERVRKELLEHCINRRDGKQVCVDAGDYRRWADWLEKQGDKDKLIKEFGEYKVKYTQEVISQQLEKQGEQKPADSYCKEYCKGFQETGKCFADGECKAKRDTEQNPAWSEEDEIGYNDSLWAIKQARTVAKNENDMGNLWCAEQWLKSLKNKVGCAVYFTTTKQWSEEDVKMLNRVKQSLYRYQDHLIGSPLADDVEMEINWLKSLNPANLKTNRVTDEDECA